MVQTIYEYRLMAVSFCLGVGVASILLHRWLLRRSDRGLTRVAWSGVALTMLIGVLLPEWAGEHERDRLRAMLAGIAPTYAREIERMGHERLSAETAADDAGYLAMIGAERRWLAANPNVNDIYTFKRRAADGALVLIVDSETDYDRSGAIDADRERRTAIGEPYEQNESIVQAFAGRRTFDGVPYTDAWGTWVSAFEPLRDANGNVDGVLGVDYDAHAWLGAVMMAQFTAITFATVLAAVLLGSSAILTLNRAELARRAAAERERERLNGQLVVASRMAGMAEVATGVLHNVGNVLNSVNISTEQIRSRLTGSKLAGLVRAVGMYRDRPAADVGAYFAGDAKGKLLPGYIAQVTDLLVGEQAALAKELDELRGSVDHIKHIVASQQSYAKHVDVSEAFELAPLFDEAERLNAMALGRHGVELARELACADRVYADRHKVLQILVNLISNAKNAFRDTGGPKRITLATERVAADDGRAMVRIAVTDTGVGIAPENLAKIFTHGFTTRSDGHGFGLHSAAIAASQMKGTLAAHSDGPGRGATFTLTLPLAVEATIPCR